MAAPDQGDRAVGAAVVAPVADLDVGRIGRGGQHPAAGEDRAIALRFAGPLPGKGAADQPMHVPGLADAQQAVDLRDVPHQLLRVALGQAPRHAEPPALPGPFILGHLKDGLDRLLLGGLNKPAGVDQQHVRLRGELRQLKPVPLKQIQHLLRVHTVFDTAQRDNPNLHRQNRQPSRKSIKIQVILSQKPPP